MLPFYQVKISPTTKLSIPCHYHFSGDFVYVGYSHHHLLRKVYQVSLKLTVATYDLMEIVEVKDAQID